MAQIDQSSFGTGDRYPVVTGLAKIDDLLDSGIQSGKLITILGESISENAALATDIAYNLAHASWFNEHRENLNVLYFSLNEIFSKLLISIASQQTSYTKYHIVNAWANCNTKEFMGGQEMRTRFIDSTGIQRSENFNNILNEKITKEKATLHISMLANFISFFFSCNLRIFGAEDDYVTSLKGIDFINNKIECQEKLSYLVELDSDITLIDCFELIAKKTDTYYNNILNIANILKFIVKNQKKSIILFMNINENDNNDALIAGFTEVSDHVLILGCENKESGLFKKVKITNSKSDNYQELQFLSGIKKFFNEQNMNSNFEKINQFEYWNSTDLKIVSNVFKHLYGLTDVITDIDIESLTRKI